MSILNNGRSAYQPVAICSRPPALRVEAQLFGVALSGPLRGWAEDLLAPAKLANEGLLEAGAVQKLWSRHLSKREQNGTALWNILMLRAWSERWLKR